MTPVGEPAKRTTSSVARLTSKPHKTTSHGGRKNKIKRASHHSSVMEGVHVGRCRGRELVPRLPLPSPPRSTADEMNCDGATSSRSERKRAPWRPEVLCWSKFVGIVCVLVAHHIFKSSFGSAGVVSYMKTKRKRRKKKKTSVGSRLASGH